MRYNSSRELLNEAVQITNDLGNVVFIGAIAVMLHIKGGRESRDLDCSIADNITEEELSRKNYIRRSEGRNGYTTPRNRKLDIYRGSVNGISLSTIIQTAKEFEIGSKKKRKNNTVSAVGLEVLMVMKKRAGREHDITDLMSIIQEKYEEINLQCLRHITTETEFTELKSAMETYKNLLT